MTQENKSEFFIVPAGCEQPLQFLSKDQSLFTKEGYLGEKITSYLLEIFLFKIVLSFWFRKTLIQN